MLAAIWWNETFLTAISISISVIDIGATYLPIGMMMNYRSMRF
jgi:hypothetical protein